MVVDTTAMAFSRLLEFVFVVTMGCFIIADANTKYGRGVVRRIVRRDADHFVCLHPLGVENFKITDAQMTASSYNDEGSVASNARPSLGVAWIAGVVDFKQYLQIDLGTIAIVTGIATYGHPSGKPRIIKYYLLYGYTEDDLQQYTGRRALDGNIMSSSKKYHELPPLRLRLLRFCPVIWIGGIAASVEIYGCGSDCVFPLGISTFKVPHKSLIATSSESLYSRPEYARLHSGAGLGAWCAGVQDKKQYIQVELGSLVIIYGIAIQGQKYKDNWVTEFKLSFSHGRHVWKRHVKRKGTIHRGNTDRDTAVFIFFRDAVIAKYMRLHPVSWHGNICLRMELYGCEKTIDMDDEGSWSCFHDNGVDTCMCKEGFDGTFCGDIDECGRFGETLCGRTSDCENTYGGYECKCKKGFTKWFADKCADIDECSIANPAEPSNADICGPNTVCINTPGSYECQCQPGYIIHPNQTSGSPCVDLDECQIPGSCPPNSTCSNFPKGYGCICMSGFSSDDPKKSCHDIDECELGAADCSQNSTCVNTIGSYVCDCGKGFVSINGTCEDIDECRGKSHSCDRHSHCSNIIGSYTCICKPGFAANNNECLDTNECLDGSHDCDANAWCVNIAASYECYCKNGYTGNGRVGRCTKIIKDTTKPTLKP